MQHPVNDWWESLEPEPSEPLAVQPGRMNLAIVGMATWGQWWHQGAAEGVIRWTLRRYYDSIDAVISGGAPGVDTVAETIANEMGLKTLIHIPEHLGWEPNGYKARNERIVESCSHLIAIRRADSRTYGSGYTADLAERRGRFVQRVVW